MHIQIARTPEERQAVYKVRKKVFVEEQKVPMNLEIDEHEEEAIHFICFENKLPIGASRLRLFKYDAKLERICVIKEFRGQSYGKQMIQAMESETLKNNLSTAKLHAQTHAILFYEQLGYQVVSNTFMDAGIPHVCMTKSLRP